MVVVVVVVVCPSQVIVVVVVVVVVHKGWISKASWVKQANQKIAQPPRGILESCVVGNRRSLMVVKRTEQFLVKKKLSTKDDQSECLR